MPMSDSATAQLTWDHLHMNSPEPVATADWYVDTFGPFAAPGESASRVQVVGFEGARIGNHEFRWYESPTEGSAGTVLDHFGWSVPNVDDACAAMAAAGAKILEDPKTVANRLRICFLEDPWGAKFELLEDPDLLGFHHVHLLVPDVEAHRRWMAKVCGGEITMFKELVPGLQRDNMWILYRPGDGLAPSKGRALDHLAFTVQGMDGHLAAMSEAGAQMDGEPRDVGAARIGFAIEPNGLRIELVEPK